jgi:hypothetical protein
MFCLLLHSIKNLKLLCKATNGGKKKNDNGPLKCSSECLGWLYCKTMVFMPIET